MTAVPDRAPPRGSVGPTRHSLSVGVWLKTKQRRAAPETLSLSCMVAEPGDAMAMNAEQFGQLMQNMAGMFTQLQQQNAQVIQQAMQAMGGAARGPREESERSVKNLLSEKDFRRLDKFDGTGWKSWSYQFKVIVNSVSAEVHRILERVETSDAEVQLDDLEEDGDVEGIERKLASLYNVIIQLVKDEPFMIARGVGNMNGAEAWRRIAQKYSPSTPATALTDLMKVMAPGRVKHQKELAAKMEEWQVRVNALRRDHGEELSEKMRIAALLQMLPLDIRDLICQSLDGKVTFLGVRDRIRSLVVNRMTMDESGPSPMEIGAALDGGYDEEMYPEYVGAVGKGRECFACGEVGHFARECRLKGGKKGSGKGYKGKDSGASGKGAPSPGKGKGAFLGTAKGNQKGVTGNPRGFQGRCNTCGGWGHRAAECPSTFRAYAVDQQWDEADDEAATPQDEPVSLGSVWMVGHVKTEKGLALSNLFQALDDDDDGDDDDNGDDDDDDAHEREKLQCSHCEGIQCGHCGVMSPPGLGCGRGGMTRMQPVHGGNGDRHFVGGVQAKKSVRFQDQVDAKKLVPMGPCEITVDSGAEESVWPAGWFKEEPLRTIGVEPKKFIAANGQPMAHYGSKQVKFCKGGGDGDGQIMSLNFEVTDVTRPLVAVRRIVEHGNDVCFDESGGRIVNRAKGTSIPLERKGGCYVLSVELLAEVEGFTWQA